MINKPLSILLLILSLNIITSAPKGDIYDHLSGAIIQLNPRNWDTQITNNRSKNVISFIHFYKPDDKKSKEYSTVIKELDANYEGMFKIAAVNCKEFRELCEKQDIKDFPSFMIYPPLPAPIMKYEGQIKMANIASYLGKFIENKSIELNNNNFDNFLSQNPNLPKILLFTDKTNIPLIFKKLSVHFDKKIEFGIVRSSLTSAVSKYKVKKYPTIMAIGIDKKTTFYQGEVKYKPIFDFCNIYQETFFVVGESQPTNEVQKKPWLNERFPEFRKESANDICFKGGKGICVLLLVKDKPTEAQEKMYMAIQDWLSPKINRGIKYKFAWADSSKQTELLKAMKITNNSEPIFALINHSSKDKYYVYDKPPTEAVMKETFDKLAGGDLRFVNFNIPELVD